MVTETGRNVKVEIGGRKRKVKLFCQRMWERLFGPLPQEKSLEKKIVQNAVFPATRAKAVTGFNSEYSQIVL